METIKIGIIGMGRMGITHFSMAVAVFLKTILMPFLKSRKLNSLLLAMLLIQDCRPFPITTELKNFIPIIRR